MEKHFNSLPHAEVDRFTDVEKPICIYFNSLPHAEVDASNGVIPSFPIGYFNSLPHAEVDLLRQAVNILHRVFQLTTSRRGRPYISVYVNSVFYFNSLPHAEVDKPQKILNQPYQNFNSLPHAEVDHILAYIMEHSRISTHYLTQR